MIALNQFLKIQYSMFGLCLIFITSCSYQEKDALFINQALIQPLENKYSWDIEFLSKKEHIQFSLLNVKLKKAEENIIRVDEFELLDHQVFTVSLDEDEKSPELYRGKYTVEFDIDKKTKKSNLILNGKKHPITHISTDFKSLGFRSEKWIDDMYSPIVLMNGHLTHKVQLEEFVFLQFIPCSNPNNEAFDEIYNDKKLLQNGYGIGGRGFDSLRGPRAPFKDL